MTANPSTGLTGGRYTLPADMGGHECWRVPRSAMVGDCVSVAYEMRGEMVTSVVPQSWLIPVKPPLPPQPPDGSVVRITQLRLGAPAPAGLRFPAHFFQRERGRLHSWRGLDPNGYDWEWEGICELGDPVLLVPDPFAEPVQLPWEVEGTLVEAKPEYGYVAISYPPAGDDRGHTHAYTPWLARDLCRAVWAAANQADKAGETT